MNIKKPEQVLEFRVFIYYPTRIDQAYIIWYFQTITHLCTDQNLQRLTSVIIWNEKMIDNINEQEQ